MKQTLKIVVAIIILVTLLGGNISVFAAGAEALAQEQSEKSNVTTSAPNTESDGDGLVSSENTSPDVEESATPDTDKDGENASEEHEIIKAKKKSSSEAKETDEEEQEDNIMLMSADLDEEGIGSLEVKIDLRLPKSGAKSDELKVELVPQEGDAIQATPASSEQQASDKQLIYNFDNNLNTGYYQLKISGKGYKTFETGKNAVQIKADTTTHLELTNGYDLYKQLQDSENKNEYGVGLIRVGDVDNNGSIADDDVNALIDKIEGTSNTNGYNYDLNNDGTVDIVDLSYVAINKGEDYKGPEPKYLAYFDKDGISSEIEEAEGTVVKDELDETAAESLTELIGNNEKHLTVQPEKPDEPIAEDNPVVIGLDLSKAATETKADHITIAPSQNPDNNITQGEITVEGLGTTGEPITLTCEIEGGTEVAKLQVKELGKYGAVSITDAPMTIAESPKGSAKVESDGSITVDFGNKIAVKKVVIKATGTKGKTTLADIAKVEFLNGMEKNIPAPQISKPNLKKDDINNSITEDGFKIIWDNVPNVTGYVVVVRATIDGKEIRREYEADGFEYELLQFGEKGAKEESIKDLMDKGTSAEGENFTTYWVSVYAVNGEWKGEISEEFAVTPKPTSKPQAVTGVTAKGGYKSISVTWNKDNRASDYFVFCKKSTDKDWILASPEEEGTDLVPDGNGGFKPGSVKKGIKETSYVISQLNGKELESLVTYDVMVKARNAMGTSDDSQISSAKTLDVQEVEMPNYKRINTSKGHGNLSEHITNIWYQTDGAKRNMKDSPLDIDEKGQSIVNEENKSLLSAKGLVDNNYSSYFECTDWDAGGFYDGNDKCIVVEFDKEYTMNYITLAKVQWDGSFQHATIRYKDKNGKTNNRVRASLVAKRNDKNGASYTAIKLAKPITTDRLVIGVGGGGRVTIAEMAFYNYDTIEDDIDALFNLKDDPSYLTLANDIKALDKNAALAKVDAIETKLDTPDESGETNPEAKGLKEKLNIARDLINDQNIGKVTKINSTMSKWYDTKSNDNQKDVEFKGSLNAWQPLGVVGRSGEEITVYVGNPYKTIGETTRLKLIFTQWRAESGKWVETELAPDKGYLHVGANTITLPNIITENRERGGSLYIEYTGLKEDEPTRYADREYSVRVSGGTEIPVLDLSKKEVIKDNYAGADRVALTDSERKERITTYINELAELVPNLEQKHNDECKKLNKEDYPVQDYNDGKNPVGSDCLLTATEIVLDDMMYSVSSKQIWDGLTEAGYAKTEDKVVGLEKSLTAMEDMMELFYNQKGLSKEGTANVAYANTFPRSRQNIRCMRMTGKAFMYAGGLHIGIQWNEVKDLSKGIPYKVDEYGRITEKGKYFGWGIAHEIGHVINQQAYVHGEVTNNYFSILAQTDSTRDTVRFDYKDVYEKVTSGKTGKAQNVFTQLGLYWQLHLAYDVSGYSYMKLDTPAKQETNSIFARMDTYARDTSKAPKGKEKQVDLKLTDSKDDNLMRLACAAAQRNLLDFFEKWGMEPNDETREYASQFETETRAIQYVNDEASTYRLEGGKALEKTELTAEITNATNNKVAENKVIFNLSVPEKDKDGLLGYEIVRTYQVKDGNEITDVTRPVAFVEGDQTTYTDIISTINNRVFTYKVVAYDKWLNKVAEKTLEPVKVSHQGEIDKTGWEVTVNASSKSDKTVINDTTNKEVDTSDANQVISGVSALADKDYDKSFEAELVEDENGYKPENVEITIELPETKKLVGLKYTADEQIKDYEIKVSNDNKEWTTVRTSKSDKYSKFENSSETLYFTKVTDGNQEVYNYDYDCTYVKFIIHDTSISIKELDLLGQAGDNVEFRDEGGVGILENNYEYDKKRQFIPENSIVFTGKYVGNPAYNVVLLWYKPQDSDKWEIVDGYQIILAKDPGEANLGETDDGDWVYVVEPKEIDEDGNTTEKDNPFYEKLKSGGEVRAQLFRVDDAQKLTGERLTSDTLDLTLPEQFSSIELTGTKE